MNAQILCSQYLRCPSCHSQLTINNEKCTVCGEMLRRTLGILDLRWPRPSRRDLEEEELIAESHGTRVLVIFLPSKDEAYLPLLGGVPDMSRPMREELRKLGIYYLHLGPAFRDRAAKGEKLFFETDEHPNVRGYALIADLVLSHLKEHAKRYGLTDWQSNLSRARS